MNEDQASKLIALVSNVLDDVRMLAVRIGSLEARIDSLETRIESLEARIGRLETKIDEFRAEVQDEFSIVKGRLHRIEQGANDCF